jgi:hypothetical protein
MLSVALASAVITCAAIIITLARVLPMRLIFGYATWIDVTFTFGLLVFMSGTLGGELIATVSGLLLALFLTIGRYVFGYSKVKYLKRCGWIVIDYPSPLKRKLKEKCNAYQSRYRRSGEHHCGVRA